MFFVGLCMQNMHVAAMLQDFTIGGLLLEHVDTTAASARRAGAV